MAPEKLHFFRQACKHEEIYILFSVSMIFYAHVVILSFIKTTFKQYY